jgi:hypothetical protein
MDQFQVSRTYHRRRPNEAWWDCKFKDGVWKVHFHADYAESTDWMAVDFSNLMKKIECEHNTWLSAVDKHWPHVEV